MVFDLDKDSDLAGILLQLGKDGETTLILNRFLDRFCHRARNRLNGIKLGLYLARRNWTGQPEALDPVNRSYDHLEHFLSQFQRCFHPIELKRIEAALSPFLQDRCAFLAPLVASHGRQLIFSGPSSATEFFFDPSALGEALDGFVKWRAMASRPESRLRWKLDVLDQQICLEWVEEGGEANSLRPNSHGKEAAKLPNLSLPLLGRIVHFHGGHLELRSPSGLRMSFPRPRDSVVTIPGHKDGQLSRTRLQPG